MFSLHRFCRFHGFSRGTPVFPWSPAWHAHALRGSTSHLWAPSTLYIALYICAHEHISSLYILHILVGFVLWVGFLESCRARGYLNPSPITHFCQVDQYRVERCLSLSLTCIVRWQLSLTCIVRWQLSLAHLFHASVLLSQRGGWCVYIFG